ncbi:MAG: hypothetical protein A3I63_03050 [Betaproteobacteria bacterium RIFCSPLOWO2_02_FULL_66_14]|nr:MAG: hypothetical protein A3I63_03050 [Betaproteobacteria bacterium RIFCSPLOWO2_02_FULL_66_14]
MTAFVRLLAVLAAALPLAFAVHAQPKEGDYEPHIGQAGKDVIWVPTPDDVVDRMLRMAQVTPHDYVIDLGAGDGKIVIAAAKLGARALGIEYNGDMARHAQRNVERAGVAARAKIVQGDIFTSDFSQANVITMYLLPALNIKLRPILLAMRPGTRVVSHSFNMEDWEPDESANLDGRRAYFWLVPARVAGNWTLEMGSERFELVLEQRYQKVDGTVALKPSHAGLRDALLRGANISFGFIDNSGVRRDFSGRVTGNRMEGSFRVESGAESRWSAVKK